MRIPIAEPPKSEGDLDVVFLGIPLDTATSNRPGARYLSIKSDNLQYLYSGMIMVNGTILPRSDGPMFIWIDWE